MSSGGERQYIHRVLLQWLRPFNLHKLVQSLISTYQSVVAVSSSLSSHPFPPPPSTLPPLSFLLPPTFPPPLLSLLPHSSIPPDGPWFHCTGSCDRHCSGACLLPRPCRHHGAHGYRGGGGEVVLPEEMEDHHHSLHR